MELQYSEEGRIQSWVPLGNVYCKPELGVCRIVLWHLINIGCVLIRT
jgi:hypothetical protein